MLSKSNIDMKGNIFVYTKQLDANATTTRFEFYTQCKWNTKKEEEEEYRNKLCHVITFSSKNTSSVFGAWPKR